MKTNGAGLTARFLVAVFLVAVAAPASLCAGPARETRDPARHTIHLDTPDHGYLNYPIRILDRSTSEVLSFDPGRDEKATISYRLTRDGSIRIRARWRSDPDLVLRTLVDWAPQPFGPHRITWDGRDASGNLVDNTRTLITFEGDGLPHARHLSDDCHEPSVALDILPRGVAIHDLSGLKARIVEPTSFGSERGFEIRVYVDYKLVTRAHLDEAEQEIVLPAHPLVPGEHLVTINVDDKADHVGVASVFVDVAPTIEGGS